MIVCQSACPWGNVTSGKAARRSSSALSVIVAFCCVAPVVAQQDSLASGGRFENIAVSFSAFDLCTKQEALALRARLHAAHNCGPGAKRRRAVRHPGAGKKCAGILVACHVCRPGSIAPQNPNEVIGICFVRLVPYYRSTGRVRIVFPLQLEQHFSLSSTAQSS